MNKFFKYVWEIIDINWNNPEDLQEVIALSEEAKLLKENKILIKFFEDFENKMYNIILDSDESDVAVREKCYMYLKLSKWIKEYLDFYVVSGNDAKERFKEKIEEGLYG